MQVEQLLKYQEAIEARRRVYMTLVSIVDGVTPVLLEGGGQPLISIDGAAFGPTVNTLVHVGSGVYYVSLDQTELNALGHVVVQYSSPAVVQQDCLCAVVGDPYDEGYPILVIECGYGYPVWET